MTGGPARSLSTGMSIGNARVSERAPSEGVHSRRICCSPLWLDTLDDETLDDGGLETTSCRQSLETVSTEGSGMVASDDANLPPYASDDSVGHAAVGGAALSVDCKSSAGEQSSSPFDCELLGSR